MRKNVDIWRTGRIFQGGTTSPFSFFSLPTASCSSSVLPNISQTQSFGISLPPGLKTVLDPDTFEFGVQDGMHTQVVTRVTNSRF